MTETSASSDPVQNENDNEDQSNPPPTKKKKRNPPGMPDPDAEIIALSPRTLLATNRFVCEICSKGFQRDQNLQLHRRLHELPYKLEPRSDKEIKKRVYVCPEPSCVYHDPSRALGDLTGIKKHYSRKHGEKKWKCDKCSKSYAVKSDWTAHSKICGTKEYRCDCGKLFFGRVKFSAHRAFCYSLIEGCFKDQGVKEGSAHSCEDPNLKITPSSNVDSNLLVPSDPQEAPAHSSSFEDPNLKINPSSNVDSNLPVPPGQQEAPAQSSSSEDPNSKNPSSNVASNLHVPSAPQATTSPETLTALITCSPAETTGTNSSTLENMEQEKLKKEAIRRRKRMYDRRRRVRMRLPEFNGAFAATPIAAINPERHQDSHDSMPNCAVQTAIEMQIPDIQEARSEVSSQASSSKDQSPATNRTVAGKDSLSSGTTQPASSVTEDGSLETPINQGSSSTPSLCLELVEYRPIFKGPLNSPTVMATERPSSPIQAHQTSLEK